MTARLERAIERGAASAVACLVQRGDLRMRSAGTQMRAAPDDHALVRNDDGTDDRVGRCPAQTALSEEERAFHERRVRASTHHFSVNSAST